MFSFLAILVIVRAALGLLGLVFFSVAGRRTHAEPLSITVFVFNPQCPLPYYLLIYDIHPNI
jgi:hypothetical protein